MMDSDRQKAEELQKAVVDHPDACYVEACPGAGKTQTLVRRVARQLQSLPARRGVAVLSFTNSAVDEFRERFVLETSSQLVFPHYVGTFDAFLSHFIVLPHGLSKCQEKPCIVDAWHDIQIFHGKSGVSASPIPLSRFDTDGRLAERAYDNLPPRQKACKNEYEAAAERALRGLANKGKIDVAAARRLVVERLKDPEYAAAVGEAMAARFDEIIVDEAQDCNDEDVEILRWLKVSGIRLVLVCDPDQAIYGFRKGAATAFATFSTTFSRLEMVGNFRSSRIICLAAATLRARSQPDLAVGVHRDIGHPIHILTYRQTVEAKAAVARDFLKLVEKLEIDPDKSIVLAHRRMMAERVSANQPQSNGGTSRAAWLASCVAGYRAEGANGRQREQSIKSMIRLIMQIEDVPDDERATLERLKKNVVMEREYYRKAVEILESLPAVCVDNAAVTAWLTAAGTVLACVTGTRVRLLAGKGKWLPLIRPKPVTGIRYATVHEAKGKAFDAVCMVVDTEGENHNLVSSWKSRSASEALRVLYVALTRARKLVVMAVHENDLSKVNSLLDEARVPVCSRDSNNANF